MNSVVIEARRWIGTPYVHQAARKGAGCDCLGLLRGVWSAITDDALIAVPPYTADWSEPQGDERLWRGVADLLDRKDKSDAAPGDVLLFRMQSGAVAKHVGLQADIGLRPTFIHAYQGHGVVENALTAPWQRRVVARFSVPAPQNTKV